MLYGDRRACKTCRHLRECRRIMVKRVSSGRVLNDSEGQLNAVGSVVESGRS